MKGLITPGARGERGKRRGHLGEDTGGEPGQAMEGLLSALPLMSLTFSQFRRALLSAVSVVDNGGGSARQSLAA